MVTQTPDSLILRLSAPRAPTALQATTQEIATELEQFLRTHPDEWVFLYDKHWRQVLRRAAHAMADPEIDQK
jgi:lauroyl/myristoyl acyltransferase